MPKWKLVSSEPPKLSSMMGKNAPRQWLLVGILHNIAGFSAADLNLKHPMILYNWYDDSPARRLSAETGVNTPYWNKSAILVRADVTLYDFEWIQP